jgi:Sulfotransferase family
MSPSSSSSTKRQSTTTTTRTTTTFSSLTPPINSGSTSCQHDETKQPLRRHSAKCRRRRRRDGHTRPRIAAAWCGFFMIVQSSYTSSSSWSVRLWRLGAALILASLLREAPVFLVEQQQHPHNSHSDASSGKSTDVGSKMTMLADLPPSQLQSSTAALSHQRHDRVDGNNSTTNQLLPVSSRTNNHSLTSRRPSNKNIMFLHVGKAGGETIKRLLKPTCYLHFHSRRGVRKCLDNLYLVHKNGNSSIDNNNNSNSTNALLENNHPKKDTTISRITQVVTSYMHVDTLRYPANDDNATSEADGYLLNLRHPLERLIS